ncbi:MAG TPA: ABC transporter ATP-binding protein [bacterium]|nr:ABC transporter ATP-binding protein [bacterium]
MADIEITNVTHEYLSAHATGVRALSGVTFTVHDGEFVTVVGPSGCGKSTLLLLVAGLLPVTQGEIRVDGQPVRAPGADRGMVFQEGAILPWRTVSQNIRHGLEIQGTDPESHEAIVRGFVKLCGLQGFEDRYPHELSGGMRQRVAVARTLAVNPKVALMDEPFAALDAQTRITLAEELIRITQHTKSTTLFVTHNVEEAVFLGDRVVVLTSRPGSVKAEFAIPVPRGDRTYAGMLQRPEMEAIKQQIFELIRTEVAVSENAEHLSPSASSPAGWLRQWLRHRTVWAVLLAVALAGGMQAAGVITAPSKLGADLAREGVSGALQRIQVRLATPAEEFHIRYLQRWGTVERVSGDRVHLRDVTSEGVRRIARVYWVSHITALEEGQQ